VCHKRKRTSEDEGTDKDDYSKSWREVLGAPPSKTDLKEWILFQKKKWAYQAKQREHVKYDFILLLKNNIR